ncbi:hypothetical protein CCHR01_17039 [Colletotrichum chrysophilum]|uniref:Uncharacterized protein n=1 Tax=Colletotrichum chrysophilum TaxID=1836956 RepID=A0AAD9A577_9PEZI|nr:hypothetical protein CCHR01_17039 [Colletotrichum chrysophilum]
MRFTITAIASILAAASAVSGLGVEEAREIRPQVEEYLNTLKSRDVEKRNFCTDHWKTCENCFEKYPYCHMDNIPSSINWQVTLLMSTTFGYLQLLPWRLLNINDDMLELNDLPLNSEQIE